MSGFKLDMGSVERDEDRVEFLNACSHLDQGLIRHLVNSRGIDVANAVDQLGQNALHFIVCSAEAAAPAHAQVSAIVELQTQLIGYLVQQGASVDAARTSDGWTPLFLAVAFGFQPMVSALLAEGASTTIKDQQGVTPEDLADKYRMPHIKGLLIHSRHKVPHSRFSCVQQGPALEQAPYPEQAKSLKQTTATEQAPSAEQALQQAPAPEHSPAPEKASTPEQTSVLEEAPAPEQTPANKQAPTSSSTSTPSHSNSTSSDSSSAASSESTSTEESSTASDAGAAEAVAASLEQQQQQQAEQQSEQCLLAAL